jgi:hypothetical protein
VYDSWGTSWGAVSAWGQSWVHTTVPPVVIVRDTHDGLRKNIEDYKRRKEELHETILRAFEEVTGETKIPTVEEIKAVEKKKPLELKALRTIRNDVLELREVNESILRASRMLQEREFEDIAFIVSIL